MSRLRLWITMSLDGFVAGPGQDADNPLGIGGMHLHEWVFPLAAWRETQGFEGGEVNESTPVVESSRANIGATVMGRNMFGGGPGPWGDDPWGGWWGENPPYHHPVFVPTRHPREPLVCKGSPTFTFVTDGIHSALDQARRAAGGADVSLSGGAKAAQQYLVAGLVDEMVISLVPVLLESGERLFENIGNDIHGLELARTVAAPKATHLKFVKGGH